MFFLVGVYDSFSENSLRRLKQGATPIAERAIGGREKVRRRLGEKVI